MIQGKITVCFMNYAIFLDIFKFYKSNEGEPMDGNLK